MSDAPQEPDSLLELARRHVAAGMSIVPIRADGSKAPLVPWKTYQSRHPTQEEIADWFGAAEKRGLALVCGAVSGNREVLDFDQPGFFELWRDLVKAQAPDLLDRIPVVRSPSGGRHAHLRSVEPVERNLKLAWAPHPDSDEVEHAKPVIAIETRGEGGYILLPGCPPECHPDHALYVLEAGPDIADAPVLSPQDRELLFSLARSLNQVAKVQRAPKELESAPPPMPPMAGGGPAASQPGMPPGTDFNLRGDWNAILLPHGWSVASRSAGVTRWLRPGKAPPGVSATTGYRRGNQNEELLYVFSTNADPFESDRYYSKFAAFALLNHGGDFRAAAQDLHTQGFGDPSVVIGNSPSIAKAQIQCLVDSLKDAPDLERLYAHIGDLASLSNADIAVVKQQLRDIFGSKLSQRDLNSAIAEHRKKKGQAARGNCTNPKRPSIVFKHEQLDGVARKALSALEAKNSPPRLFSRGGELVRMRLDERGRPSIQLVDDTLMVFRLSQVANWFDLDKDGNPVPGFPPQQIARVLCRATGASFPPLEGITAVPLVRPDGSIITTAGYDQVTGIIYRPSPTFKMPHVSLSPDSEDLSRARMLLCDELLADFPFTDDASRANALALAAGAILRPAFTGPTPLAVVDAPKQGTGKSLLVKVLSFIVTGLPAHFRTLADDDNETRKAITGVLLDGPAMAVLDNVEKPVASPSLAMLLTTDQWCDRLLGANRELRLPARTQWVVTGNNVVLRGDLGRRAFLIRVDARVAQPWLRVEFRHRDLLSWVRERHGDLLWALLTIVRAWFAAKCPPPTTPLLGSYEGWSRTVGGVLEYAGIGSFLGNLQESYEQSNTDEGDWERFLRSWRGHFGEQWVTAQALAKHYGYRSEGSCSGVTDDICSQLPESLQGALASNKSLPRALGNALRRRVDTRYGSQGLHVERCEDPLANVIRWRVLADREPVDISSSPPSSAGDGREAFTL